MFYMELTMKIKIIDKCCNEYTEIEIKQSDLILLFSTKSPVEIAPAKAGHSIILHPDKTIEYVRSDPAHNPLNKH